MLTQSELSLWAAAMSGTTAFIRYDDGGEHYVELGNSGSLIWEWGLLVAPSEMLLQRFVANSTLRGPLPPQAALCVVKVSAPGDTAVRTYTSESLR